VALIIGVVVASVAFIALLIFLKLKNVTRQNRRVTTRAIHSTLKRILLTHLQVVTLVASLNVPWPSGFIGMVTVFSSASTMSQHMSALSCEMSRGKSSIGREANLLYDQTIMLVFLPPAIIFFLFCYWVVAAPCCSCMRCGKPLRASIRCETLNKKKKPKRKQRSDQLSIEMTSKSTGDTNKEGKHSTELSGGDEIKRSEEEENIKQKSQPTKSVASDQDKRMSTRDAWVFSVTLISYIVYPTLVRFPFELLQCRNVNGNLYLERDLEEPCYKSGSRHIAMLWGVAIPALLLYALGMPLGIFIIMWRARHRLDTNKYRFRLGLLYSGYRSDRWWWELVVSARKVMIISLASFGFNEDVQVHLVLGLMLMLLVCHYTFQPFELSNRQGELLHRVERNSLLALISMLWAGVVFIMAKDHKCVTDLCIHLHNMLIIIVILVNVVLLVHGGWLFSYFWLKSQHVFEKIEHLHVKDRLKSMKLRASLMSRMSFRSNSTSDQEERKKQVQEMKEVERKYANTGKTETRDRCDTQESRRKLMKSFQSHKKKKNRSRHHDVKTQNVINPVMMVNLSPPPMQAGVTDLGSPPPLPGPLPLSGPSLL
jgi:hypothetical protein